MENTHMLLCASLIRIKAKVSSDSLSKILNLDLKIYINLRYVFLSHANVICKPPGFLRLIRSVILRYSIDKFKSRIGLC